MRGIWILGILLLLLAAVLWVRVGIFLKWTDTGMQTAALRLGVFRIPLFPAKKKPKAKAEENRRRERRRP